MMIIDYSKCTIDPVHASVKNLNQRKSTSILTLDVHRKSSQTFLVSAPTMAWKMMKTRRCSASGKSLQTC